MRPGPAGFPSWLALQHLQIRMVSSVKPTLTPEFTFTNILPLGIFLNLDEVRQWNFSKNCRGHHGGQLSQLPVYVLTVAGDVFPA